MDGFKLSLLAFVPFLFLAIAVEATGDELHTFIVHVQPQESHVPATADDRKAWYETFLPEDGRLLHAYHHVASGFAARLTPRELDAVSAMPGFVSAVPDQTYTLQTTHTPQFLGLGAPAPPQGKRWSSSYGSGAGAGVIVGVIDTGVFPDHPSFSDAGMPPPPAKWKGRCDFNGLVCNNKLIGARTFIANATKASSSYGERSPPVDDVGHGTHTASTAAGAVVPGAHVLGQGLGVAAGIAPRAHVAVYKVCPNESCASSDMLAGVDAAVADGCDVLSISLGGPSEPFYQSPLAVGTFGAMEKGVFVSMAAGNAGPNVSSVLNDAPWMLTVAASTMDRSIRTTVRLGNGLQFDGESLYQPSGSPNTFYPLVYAGASGKPLAQFCGNGSLDGLDVRGKIVVCEFGGGPNITRIIKGAVVQSAGGAGMILPNHFLQGHTTLAEAHVLPASHVGYAAGSAIMAYINSTANPVAQILPRGTILGTTPAPAMAFFSSRGPSVQSPGILKPDITGPGVNVLAAWPFRVGPPSAPVFPGPTFNIISGTSMSTPHLSGVAAFIKSRHPHWSPAAIKSAIMTTADITDRSGNPILDEQQAPANFFATGAGHVNPEKAADPGLVYDIAPCDYVGYLCGLYTSQQVSVIARRPVNCSAVTVIPEHQLNYPSISVTLPRAWNSTTKPVLVRRTARNVGEAPSEYYAAVDMLDETVTVRVFPRTLQFTEVNQEKDFTVVVWPAGQGGARVVQGAVRWVSETHTVRSPFSVTFA
ncbi:subtilisin-like protease [Oryza brachyantha]|uniref:subtilisin-like protease n=1 Tax=Oryza brachyantha TaxID=4533 RepID=UPI001ADD2D7C|nr:subtilisin-like protease [Oryza brachyantha]